MLPSLQFAKWVKLMNLKTCIVTLCISLCSLGGAAQAASVQADYDLGYALSFSSDEFLWVIISSGETTTLAAPTFDASGTAVESVGGTSIRTDGAGADAPTSFGISGIVTADSGDVVDGMAWFRVQSASAMVLNYIGTSSMEVTVTPTGGSSFVKTAPDWPRSTAGGRVTTFARVNQGADLSDVATGPFDLLSETEIIHDPFLANDSGATIFGEAFLDPNGQSVPAPVVFTLTPDAPLLSLQVQAFAAGRALRLEPLAPVPLPAGGVLLLAGLCALPVLRRQSA